MKYTWCAYLSPPFTSINHYNLQKNSNITLLPCLFISIFKFLAFAILEFMNRILFSSLERDITQFFHQNLYHEVNMISVSLKLHST